MRDRIPEDLARKALRTLFPGKDHSGRAPFEIRVAAIRLPELVFDYPELRDANYNPYVDHEIGEGTLASDEALDALRRKLNSESSDRFAEIIISMRDGKPWPAISERPARSVSPRRRPRRRRQPRIGRRKDHEVKTNGFFITSH